jgi:hypothetical protein
MSHQSPHTSPVKKKVKETVKSVTRRAMDLIKGSKTSPSKIPALFRMKGWAKPKVLMEDEKQDVFAAEAEGQRMRAEALSKRERVAKAERDVKRKQDQNEWQRRHRALKRARQEDTNPGGRK